MPTKSKSTKLRSERMKQLRQKKDMITKPDQDQQAGKGGNAMLEEDAQYDADLDLAQDEGLEE
uniref:Uncharacterized protein n=1 Tax=Romanomermis culicivorax TaxID=13658 RepID=A0A915HT91_ROMCU